MTRLFHAICILLLIAPAKVFSQGRFLFQPSTRSKAVIPFELINNLILVPITVNGVELTFLVDTGVDETILFSLDDKEEVAFTDVEKVMFKGLGSAEPIEGLKSSNNIMSFPGLADSHHDIYIILEQEINFSSSIGVPVNGIIGYHFFKDHLVEIDYDRKKITVYNENAKLPKRLRSKYSSEDISIELNKPYLITEVAVAERQFNAKLLVDLGSSDAVWLFADKIEGVSIPQANFEDFLGRGFSGEIHGRRARIERFTFGGHEFANPIAAFPDSSSIRNIAMVKERVGSVGGEILKRFSLMLDYRRKKIYFKKGLSFAEPFQYNMSGIELHHDGMTWVQETVEMKSVHQSNEYNINGEKIPTSFTYKFELKPTYSITNVRAGSPAADCGLKPGDVILTINNRPGYRYSLQQINSLFKSGEGKEIDIVIERDKVKMPFRFRLKKIL